MLQTLTSANPARDELRLRFNDRLVVRDELTRRVVSYQGNKSEPGLRWMRYKEGYSAGLVERALRSAEGPVLDPFAGLGTTVLVASGAGHEATGIELMPVGVRAARAIALVANDIAEADIAAAGERLLAAVESGRADSRRRFPHVAITERAFPTETEQALANAREHLSTIEDEPLRTVLDVACMSVLEDVSYTRKDGQYLRWDNRSGRKLRGDIHKGPVLPFRDALERKLRDIIEDAPALRTLYGGRMPAFVQGSALRELARMGDGAVGVTVTSPPYANRYDYTRTYALELAWLGYDQAAFSALRQDLVSATVENRPKDAILNGRYPRPDVSEKAAGIYEAQTALHEALAALQYKRDELGNPHVIRLVANYFREMCLVIVELARLTRRDGLVVMVNDNVQYHGEEVPVDLILSNMAEAAGLHCEEISVLPRGKGNASQQMGRFGRRELRKCVYYWRKE